MKGLQLEVQKSPFGQFLQSYGPLAVPLFQRPYSWDKEQWLQLWEDLTSSLTGDYLIGGVVLCGTDHGYNQIIDGQQRLTTLTILAAALRDTADSLGEKKATLTVASFQNDFIAKRSLAGPKSRPYLKLGQVDHEWFQRHIQVEPDDDAFDPPSSNVRKGTQSSVRLQWKCYQFFRAQIEAATAGLTVQQKLDLFAQYHSLLESRLWFVVTRVPDDNTAFTLFEVLNDRGLDLTVADLIKNVVLSEGGRHDVFEEARDYWSAIADALDYKVVSSFLRAQWMSESGEKITDKALFAALKEKLRSASKKEFLEILSRWSRAAEAYAEITGSEDPSSEDDGLTRELKLLKAYGFKVVHTVLLAVWATTTDREAKKRASAVRLLRTFLIRYAVFANQVTNTLEGKLAELASEIREHGAFEISWLRTKLVSLSPDEKLVWGGFEVLEPSAHFARLLLIEIEEHVSGDEKLVRDAKAVHVEHIFPQKPDKDWLTSFNAKGEHETYLTRLGNLTLLAGAKNRSASNKSYSTKVQLYKKSELKITRSIPSDYRTWTADSVKKRQAELMDYAQEVWALE